MRLLAGLALMSLVLWIVSFKLGVSLNAEVATQDSLRSWWHCGIDVGDGGIR